MTISKSHTISAGIFVILYLIFKGNEVSAGQNARRAYMTLDENGLHYHENGLHYHYGESRNNRTVVSEAFYMPLNNETGGWHYLEVRTYSVACNEDQAYSAGFLEALLTYDSIYMHWYNTLHGVCDDRRAQCRKVQDHLNSSLVWIKNMITNHSNTDPYWHQVKLFFTQLEGLVDGYETARKHHAVTSKKLTFTDLFWLNVQGDVDELFSIYTANNNEAYVPVKVTGDRLPGVASCSALIKLLADSSDLYTSHDTWSSLQSMFKMQKKYNFQFTTITNSSEMIPGTVIVFSSYPGVIQSGDDFYVTSAGLTTLETTTGNSNASLWKYVKKQGQVMEQVRAMVANRLANSGKNWTDIFSRYNSGTYNNQWMVVDYKLFKKGTSKCQLKDGLLWVLEQLPGHIRAEDMTRVLKKQTYWPSYNSPYFPDIYNLSGQAELAKKYGDWFTYDRTPRALIFKRDHVKVKNTTSMIALMRYNDYLHDPLSRCNCTPPYSGENAIACRSDVNPINGTYPFDALGHRAHVATDMKLVTAELVSKLQFIAIAGPPYNNDIPPFQWSTSDFKNLPHLGHPDIFEYGPVQFDWVFH